MRIIECDRCRKRMTRVEKVGYINLDWRDVKTGDLEGKPNEFDDWDFCDECMAEIHEFVRMKPAAPAPVEQDPVREKPKATIKKPIADGSKWSPITPEKIEQIRQMARKGKTVKEIVEETGVSDPTVRKYKREVDNEADMQELREVSPDV